MHKKDVSILDWIIVFIILTIPVINFIMIIVFALGNFNTSLKNFAKALIFVLIFGVLLLTFYYGSLRHFIQNFPRLN